MEAMNDAELKSRMRSGDRSAFAELVDRHKDVLVNYLTRLTRSRDRAEEFAQEAFLRLYQAAPRYKEQGRLGFLSARLCRGKDLLLPPYKASQIKSPTSVVLEPIRPADCDFIFGHVAMIAFSTFSPARSAAASPFWLPTTLSSMATEAMAAMGLITFLPVYLGALPPMGSNILTPSGLMLPPAATPMPP